MDLVSLAAGCALNGVLLITPVQTSCDGSNSQPALSEGAESSAVAQWQPIIAEAAGRFGIPQSWIARVLQAESAGRTMRNGRPITSAKGAMGLMQLMPGTYDDMRRDYSLGPDPFAPHDNILAGTAYLRAMFDRFGNGAFAAYKAGPQRYQAFLEGKQALPSETISYLAKVQQPLQSARQQSGQEEGGSPSNGLFFRLSRAKSSTETPLRQSVRSETIPAVARTVFVNTAQGATSTSFAQPDSLFVVLSSDNRNASQ